MLDTDLEGAMASLRQMLAADGYSLEFFDGHGPALTAVIVAEAGACADCLVPKPLMRSHFESALRTHFGSAVPDIHLIYPADIAKLVERFR